MRGAGVDVTKPETLAQALPSRHTSPPSVPQPRHHCSVPRTAIQHRPPWLPHGLVLHAAHRAPSSARPAQHPHCAFLPPHARRAHVARARHASLPHPPLQALAGAGACIFASSASGRGGNALQVRRPHGASAALPPCACLLASVARCSTGARRGVPLRLKHAAWPMPSRPHAPSRHGPMPPPLRFAIRPSKPTRAQQADTAPRPPPPCAHRARTAACLHAPRAAWRGGLTWLAGGPGLPAGWAGNSISDGSCISAGWLGW